jgi:hypothetical protein
MGSIVRAITGGGGSRRSAPAPAPAPVVQAPTPVVKTQSLKSPNSEVKNRQARSAGGGGGTPANSRTLFAGAEGGDSALGATNKTILGG